jgi:hypothetical protein
VDRTKLGPSQNGSEARPAIRNVERRLLEAVEVIAQVLNPRTNGDSRAYSFFLFKSANVALQAFG